MTDRAFFVENGYWVGPPVLDATQVAVVSKHFDAVVTGQYERGRAPRGVNQFGDAMVKVAWALWADAVIYQVVTDPVIAETAATLLGVPELYLWADSLYWKAPQAVGENAVVGWHQDKQYWATSSTDQMITACVALYDANETTGGMRFACGSHRWGLVGGTEALEGEANTGEHRRPPIPVGARWEEVCPTLMPGQVTYHHALTFHGSGTNRSPSPRRSITIHYVSGEGRLVNWEPTDDGFFSTIGLGNPFRGPLFPRLWPYVE